MHASFHRSLTLGFLSRNQLFIRSPSPLFSRGKRFLETRSVCDAGNVEQGEKEGEMRSKDRDDRLNRDEVGFGETRKEKKGRKKEGRKEGKVGKMIHIFV